MTDETVDAVDSTTDTSTGANAATDTQTANSTQAAASTVLDGQSEATDRAAPADWPEDWREKYAGTDEKLAKRLGRYASPKAALDALISAQDKISRGELKKPLGEKPSPEDLAAYRKDLGIPETPDKYDLKLSDGRVVGEDDKPLIGKFLERMHGKNATPDQVSAGVDAYYEVVEEIQAQRYEADEDFRRTAEDELRAEWGSEFRRNVNMVSGLLSGAPEGVKEMLLEARTEEGVRIINSPDTLRWLTQLAREVNPVATVVPGAGANAGQAISDELATLTKMMGDQKSDYWKGPNAEKLQARYRDLVNAQSKMK